jgi:hypothetical protein
MSRLNWDLFVTHINMGYLSHLKWDSCVTHINMGYLTSKQSMSKSLHILTLCFIEIFSDSVSNIWKYNLYFEQQCGCKTKKSLKIPKGGNQNLYIVEKQTTQWPKEKGQKDKQHLQNIHIKLKIE